jgi:hypothetical protein
LRSAVLRVLDAKTHQHPTIAPSVSIG